MSDLSIATEELVQRTFVYEVGLREPILAMLMTEGKVSSRGGTYITYDLVKDDAKDEAQAYAAGEGLTVAQSEFLDQAKFKYKYVQMPIRYNVDDEIQNHLATSEVKRHDLVTLITERAQDGLRRHLTVRLHTASSTDAGKYVQSIYDACDHSRTYGTVTSSTTAKTWWNGASLAGTWADRDTAMTVELNNLRTIGYIVDRYVAPGQKKYCFLPEGLHSKVRGILEGKVSYQMGTADNSKMAKFGFKSFMYDGVEYIADSYMTLNSQTDYLLMLNPDTWELRLHPSAAFKVTPFFDQSQVAGGADEKVARIKFAGNVCCKKPNANFWNSTAT
ncbi:MAG: phage major capsid protein [Lentisphaeria bacterium]